MARQRPMPELMRSGKFHAESAATLYEQMLAGPGVTTSGDYDALGRSLQMASDALAEASRMAFAARDEIKGDWS